MKAKVDQLEKEKIDLQQRVEQLESAVSSQNKADQIIIASGKKNVLAGYFLKIYKRRKTHRCAFNFKNVLKFPK